MTKKTILVSIFLLSILVWAAIHFDFQVQAAVVAPQTQPPGVERMESEKIGVILDLPEGSTQLEVGKEVYRLVCSACHAYDGSGLTDEWRSTWNPEDQNCWQSKCHGYNHPEDGFYLPQSPAIVGSFFPYLFPTALNLNDYIRKTMPWHDPGVLPEDQAWAVTAYTLFLNGYELPGDLTPESAASYRLEKIDLATSTLESEVPAVPAAPAEIVEMDDPPAATEESSWSELHENRSSLTRGIYWGLGVLLAVFLALFMIRLKNRRN